MRGIATVRVPKPTEYQEFPACPFCQKKYPTELLVKGHIDECERAGLKWIAWWTEINGHDSGIAVDRDGDFWSKIMHRGDEYDEYIMIPISLEAAAGYVKILVAHASEYAGAARKIREYLEKNVPS